MLAAFMPCAAVAYDEMKYGDYLYYRINEDGTSVTITDCDETASGAITIPDKIENLPVTRITGSAFWDCTSLTSLTIPDSVTDINRRAFHNCGSLNISVSENNPNYCDIDGVLFNKDKTEILAYTKDKIQPVYTVPLGTVSIGHNAFIDCTYLTNISLPESLTDINSEAFYGCTSLKSAIIPNGITLIGYFVFRECSSLESITIPDSVTIIGYCAFVGCESLTDVYYGGSEEQWKQITCDVSNGRLLNAAIHYNSAVYDPITPAALTVTPSGGGYVLTAETDYDGDAYAAAYDAEGALISVVSEPFTDGTATVAPDIAGAAKIKFFVWTNAVQPVTLAEEITLN